MEKCDCCGEEKVLTGIGSWKLCKKCILVATSGKKGMELVEKIITKKHMEKLKTKWL